MAVNDRISSMVQTDDGGGLIEFADRSVDTLLILFREGWPKYDRALST